MKTKILIIGGVAAGATAAARARRVNEDAEVTVIERGPYVSFANCGLPYFISGDIEHRSDLLLQTPEGFRSRYDVETHVNTEVLEIDRANKRVRTQSASGEVWHHYDKLILAQGGNPIVPRIPGYDAPNAFKLWTIPDMDRLAEFLDKQTPRTAVVIGGGFIGIEMAEAFAQRGLKTTIVELMPTVMSIMDPEYGRRIANELRHSGVSVETGVAVKAILRETREVELSDGRKLPADVVLFSVGVSPENTLAKSCGLELGATGAVLVDDQLRTSDHDIYAAGDMIEVVNKVSGKRVRAPLAGPANRQGRIAASNALGDSQKYDGVIGTSVVKVFEATAASTGLSEKAARDAGFKIGTVVIHKDHHASYYPGGKELSLKLIYDKESRRVLGAQAFGHGGVEKRVDVLATALQAKLTLDDLAELDLAYAPPYSSANDPINLAAFAALNDISGFSPLISSSDLVQELGSEEKPLVLDVRTPGEFAHGHLAGAVHVPLDSLRSHLDALDKNRRTIVYCKAGYRGHLALRILRGHGFTNVANLTGGYTSMLTVPELKIEEK